MGSSPTSGTKYIFYTLQTIFMNKKGIIGFMVVILIAALAFLGIYQISKNTSSSRQTPPPPPKITDVRPATTTTTTARHEFTNPTGKYSFEYPLAWKVAVNEADQKNTLFGPDADGSTGLGGVEIFKNEPVLFIGDIDAEWSNKRIITVDGIEATRSHYKGVVSGESVELPTQDFIYHIYINSEKAEDIQLFDEIVASFRFIKSDLKTNGYKHTYIYKTDANTMVTGQKLIFASPEGVTSSVPGLIALQIDLATRVHANGIYENMGEDITSFDMPISPSDKNIIFLSTAEPLDPPKEGLMNNNIILNRIYSYNLQTSELTEIYKKEVRDFASQGAVMWRIVGIEGNNLIILYDYMGNSPGPCLEIFYSYKDRMAYLDTKNISAGLQPYTVDQAMVDAKKIEEEKCAAGVQ